MIEDAERRTTIRGGLHRKSLADARQRAGLARRLGLTPTEVLAIQYLARSGELTPGQLAFLLQLSSGGTTGLIQRLVAAEHATRHQSTRDKRNALIRLTPAISAWATSAWAPFVADLDALIDEFSDEEQAVIERFTERAAEAAERHADRIAHDADTDAHDQLAVPLPALWG